MTKEIQGNPYLTQAGNVDINNRIYVTKVTTTNAENWRNATEQEMLSNTGEVLEAKLNKLEMLEDYDKSVNVNAFNLGDFVLWLAPDDRQNAKRFLESALKVGMTEDSEIEYLVQNIPIKAKIGQLLQILALLDVYAGKALNVTQQHINNIKELLTLQEVADYDFTNGYPDKIRVEL